MRGLRVGVTAFALSQAIAASAQAGELTVNSPADVVAGSNGACTLREAVLVANGSIVMPECGAPSAGVGPAGKDTITFAPAVTKIDLATVNAQLAIGSDIEIVGPGVEVTNSAPASAAGRIFKIAAGNAVAISGLEITGGDVNGTGLVAGGAIHNAGELTLTNVRIADSSATVANAGNLQSGTAGGAVFGDQGGTLTLDRVVIEDNDAVLTSNSGTDGIANSSGGGIHSEGPLTLDRTTVDGNAAATVNTVGPDTILAFGGGIHQTAVGALSVRRSTISRNSATATNSVTATTIAEGAGISAGSGADHRVELSTVSGNALAASAPGATPTLKGGGLAAPVGASIAVVSSTIADNGAAGGASGANVSGATSFSFRNSIIADPRGGPAADNCDGTAASGGFNIDDEGSCDLSDLTQTDLIADPGLAALGDNGGPTETMLPGAPAAIDQGEDGEQSVIGDQRGLGRPVDLPSAGNGQGDKSDIGAVELQLPAPPADLPAAPAKPSTPAEAGTSGTGRRAAALRKCERKPRGKRRSCRKRARLLPP